MSEKLEGNQTYEVPVTEGFSKKIETNANSYREAEQKVEKAGYTIDQYRSGNKK